MPAPATLKRCECNACQSAVPLMQRHGTIVQLFKSAACRLCKRPVHIHPAQHVHRVEYLITLDTKQSMLCQTAWRPCCVRLLDNLTCSCIQLSHKATQDEYSKFIADHGGSTNAYTASESTNFHFSVKCTNQLLSRNSQAMPRIWPSSA